MASNVPVLLNYGWSQMDLIILIRQGRTKDAKEYQKTSGHPGAKGYLKTPRGYGHEP
jgi:hypothetical protein